MTTDVKGLPYLFIDDMAGLLVGIPDDSIISRTVYKDDQIKVVLFAFAAGQSLSEHSAATPAIVQIIAGEAEIGLGEATHEAHAGAWIHMAARLRHSIVARTPLIMLLTLLPKASEAGEGVEI